jgi:hypothetical protein
VVAGHGLGPHGPEKIVEAGPELLQAHDPDANPPTVGSAGRLPAPPAAYRRGMVPGTGSNTLDVVLEIGIALAMLVTIVLLVRHYRGR